MDVLYYSNYCNHCKELLTLIAKSTIKQHLYFICVDKRIKKGSQVFIVLESGKEIKLPEVVKTVPTLLLFSRGNMTLEGNKIYDYVRDYEKKTQKHNDEPNAFSLNFDSFTSDSYSFIDTKPEEMNAKGNGGMMQMHNYVGVNDIGEIVTPPENYVSNRIASSDENVLEKYMQEREKDIPKHTNPLTGRNS